MTPVIRTVFKVLLVTLHHSDPLTDDIMDCSVFCKVLTHVCQKCFLEVGQGHPYVYPSQFSRREKSLPLQTTEFSCVGKIKEVLNLGIGLF